ncbi:hypothetical protein J4480_06115 [Candidatus Woesearchaeota archaeon]|nr:hypothetical protein [Candidatus Woesearchaeota archaeon]
MDRVPDISDERLEQLAIQIRPVARFVGEKLHPGGELYYTKGPDNPRELRKKAYTWVAEPLRLATNLTHYNDITTYHEFGASVIFSATIAEVLAQIPEEDLERAVAFESLYYHLTSQDIIECYHKTATRLYERDCN